MAQMARKYYEGLDLDVLERLIQIFKQDMIAFGYSFDIKTRIIGGLTV